jgi:hypothetical protein
VKSLHTVARWLFVAALAADVGSKCCCLATLSAANTAASAAGRFDRVGFESAMRGSDIALYLCAFLLGAGWLLAGIGVLVWLWSKLKGERGGWGVTLVLLLVYVAMNFIMM